MSITWHHAALFASGLALGGAVGAMAALNLHRPAPRDEPRAVSAAPAVAPLARISPVQPISGCPLHPAIAPADARDARYQVPAELSGYSVRDIGAFIVIGKEAAAAGRPHDAEVAFLVSCRVADQLRGAGSLESADARYQLARVYDGALRSSPMPGSAGELRQRAEQLFSASLQTYTAQYGADHEKARFAAEGLAQIRQGATPVGAIAAQAAPAPAAPAVPAATPAPAANGVALAAVRPAARPAAETVAAAPRAARKAPAARAKPSFDCARARSAAEKIICADARLARLDRELASLQARARVSARDPYIFKRRSDAEWRRREETCHDRGCLLQWYAQRRQQLLGEINSG